MITVYPAPAVTPYELQVARGLVAGTKSVFKFGFNAALNTSEETVWAASTLYVYPPSASVMTVSSGSTLDTAAGTGARTVTISGLDASYNEQSETVTLNGQTAVNTVGTYIRVNRAFVVTAGSTGTAQGNIYVGTGTVTTGIPANVYALIILGDNQTLMALWTVPAGYTAYIISAYVNAGDASVTQYITARFVQRPFGGVFRTASKITLHDGIGNFFDAVPPSFTEKTDVEVRATSSSGTNQVGASFTIIYIAN